ncbi:MAG: hypothetical protein HOJ16_09310 [Candidatus Peribacter sp.]|jgi:hypothetical protein|nr:hypothetical protein [Candidatus Peribacter sp.]
MILKEGSKGTDVKELQRALKELGYNVGVADGDFGPATQRQVELFQEANDLYGDGIVGKGTLSVMNKLLPYEFQFQIDGEPDPGETFQKLPWTKVEADQVEGSQGYSYFRLRKDAAEAYNRLREDVLALGGVITSAGAKRSLTDSKPAASRSIKSLHYTGLAFDMALDSGMNNPKKERFVIEEDGDRGWNVWCRTENENVPVRKITAYTYNNTRVIVEDRFFSFTELAKKHGFEGINCRRSFKRGGSYLGAEWWHYNFTKPLIPGVSTFGGELLKMYSLAEVKATFKPWNQAKNCVWQKSWF